MSASEMPPAPMRSLIVRFWCSAEGGDWRVMVKAVGSEEVRHFAGVAAFVAWVEDTFSRNEDSSGGE